MKLISLWKSRDNNIRREDPVELQNQQPPHITFTPTGYTHLMGDWPAFFGWGDLGEKQILQKLDHKSRLRATPQSANSNQIQYNWSMDQATPGITAQSPPRVRIDGEVYDLDVGSGHPSGAAATKGSFVQRLIVLRDLSSDRSNPGRFLSMMSSSQYERIGKARPILQASLRLK